MLPLDGAGLVLSTTHTTREEKGLASRPLHPSSQIYSRRRALIDTFDCTVPSFQRTTQTLQQVHNGPYPTDLSLPLRHNTFYTTPYRPRKRVQTDFAYPKAYRHSLSFATGLPRQAWNCEVTSLPDYVSRQ
ncbi:PIF1-like helicase domain-containing protein [Apiospora arundinis]